MGSATANAWHCNGVTKYAATARVARIVHCWLETNVKDACGSFTESTADGEIGVRSVAMLWAIIAVLIILWLLGFIGHVAGSFVHLLLVIALIVLVVQLLTG